MKTVGREERSSWRGTEGERFSCLSHLQTILPVYVVLLRVLVGGSQCPDERQEAPC